MNPLKNNREVAYYLRDSGATLLLAWHTVAGEAGEGAAETGALVVEVTEPALPRCSSASPRFPRASSRPAATTR